MTPALQSHTPRVRALNYDSLALNIGCQEALGVEIRGFAALTQVCVAEHDATSSKLSKIETLGYAMGPSVTGETFPFATLWAAWIEANSVRVLKGVGLTPEPPAGGQVSQLWPLTDGTALSIGFAAIGQMGIAVQTGTDTITLKRYADALGTIASTVITGRSPLLWFTGELYSDEPGEFRELVLLYLRPERPRSIFARFEGEDFGVEHEAVEDLPIDLLTLLHAEADPERRLKIYARSPSGRDVTVYSAAYAAKGIHRATLEPAFTSGFYYEAALDAGAEDELPATLHCAFTSGFYFNALKSAGATQADEHTLSITFTSGEYQ